MRVTCAVPVTSCPSPNHGPRPAGDTVSLLVFHYTGMASAQAALDRLCDPEAEVSAHYTVDEAGGVYHHVDEDQCAWHAGVSVWRGQQALNRISIGIELVNPGHTTDLLPFPETQMISVIALAQDIVRRHRIQPVNVVGHSDIAPTRKQDPGELFDWSRLSRAGVGLWPRPNFRATNVGLTLDPTSDPDVIKELQATLRTIGYGITVDGVYGPETRAVIAAFQRHYWQGGVTGQACPVTISLVGHIAGLAG